MSQRNGDQLWDDRYHGVNQHCDALIFLGNRGDSAIRGGSVCRDVGTCPGHFIWTALLFVKFEKRDEIRKVPDTRFYSLLFERVFTCCVRACLISCGLVHFLLFLCRPFFFFE
jgi:hypothetical protein